MPLLWTFCDHPETGLPNTNNALEGLFSDLKTKVRVHSGISKLKDISTIAGIYDLRRLFFCMFLKKTGMAALRPSQFCLAC